MARALLRHFSVEEAPGKMCGADTRDTTSQLWRTRIAAASSGISNIGVKWGNRPVRAGGVAPHRVRLLRRSARCLRTLHALTRPNSCLPTCTCHRVTIAHAWVTRHVATGQHPNSLASNQQSKQWAASGQPLFCGVGRRPPVRCASTRRCLVPLRWRNRRRLTTAARCACRAATASTHNPPPDDSGQE